MKKKENCKFKKIYKIIFETTYKNGKKKQLKNLMILK